MVWSVCVKQKSLRLRSTNRATRQRNKSTSRTAIGLHVNALTGALSPDALETATTCEKPRVNYFRGWRTRPNLCERWSHVLHSCSRTSAMCTDRKQLPLCCARHYRPEPPQPRVFSSSYWCELLLLWDRQISSWLCRDEHTAVEGCAMSVQICGVSAHCCR